MADGTDIDALLSRISIRAWAGALAFASVALEDMPDPQAAILAAFVRSLLFHRPCDDQDSLKWAKLVVYWEHIIGARGVALAAPAASAELTRTTAALKDAGLPVAASVLAETGADGLDALRSLLAAVPADALIEGMDMGAHGSWVATALRILTAVPA